MSKPPTGFRAARGIAPPLPGAPLPEDAIRALRDGNTDIAALAARVLALSEQTEHEPWAYDMLSGHVISRIWTADVEFVADLDTEGSENVTGEFIAYTRTAAPILAEALLFAKGIIAYLTDHLNGVERPADCDTCTELLDEWRAMMGTNDGAVSKAKSACTSQN